MTASKIRLLDEQTINKIAAGEVIENPASVVKELVENAIDANATAITIEIQEGGRELIRISDNGIGMTQEDALLCLERHATSKISQVEDIEALHTMGFRGEAIPSIASISKFSLLTAYELNPSEATLILVEGGKLLSCSNAARSKGTTIEVKSLFFNVPVRRKFQKSPSFDTQEIMKMLTLLSLAHPRIFFELISDQKKLLKTPHFSEEATFHENLSERIKHVLGNEVLDSLIPLEFIQEPYVLKGFIGESHLHRPNRSSQFLFINQRSIYSPLIAAAVREGYGSMLPNQRFPFFVIHLQMPGQLFDVNVHPQKKEVRLRQEFELKEAVIGAVQKALRKQQTQHTFFAASPLEDHLPKETEIPPFWNSYASLLTKNTFEMPLKAHENEWEFKQLPLNAENRALDTETLNADLASQKNSFEPSLFSLQKLPLQIPVVMSTIPGYLLIQPFNLPKELFRLKEGELEGGLAIVDQKAAYSRIYFEKLLKQKESHELEPLLVPLTIQLSLEESRQIQGNLKALNEMGFSLREFGENTLILDAFPRFIQEDQIESCLNILLKELAENQMSRHLESEKEKQLALMACRASLPKMKQLSIDEGQYLMKELMTCEMPAQCPSGKPTCLYLSREEINKLFRLGG